MEAIKNKAHKALRWSERYTKTDMVYLAKGGFWQTVGQTVTSILSLVLLIFFANFLPKETYGLYKYILSLASILSIFTLTGMNQAVTQAVATGNDSALRTSVSYQIKWNLLASSTFWVVSGYYFFHSNLPVAGSLLILGIFSPLSLALNTYGAYLEGKRAFRLSNLFSIISTTVYVIGMITAILLSKNIAWLIVAYSLVTFGTNLILYIITIRMFRVTTAPADHVLKYGRNLTFIGLVGTIVSQVDSLILNHFWGPIQLAIYSLATAIPNRAISFTKSWVNISFPKFATKTSEEINASFYRRIFQGLAVGLLLTILYAVSAPFLFKLLIPKYLDSVFYSQILMISLVFAIPNRYLSVLFTAKKMTRLIFINGLVQSFIRILLYIILGIWGGVLGLVFAQVLNSLISMIINITLWRTKQV
jgi:O-antigen/teichoic acid export membrane protein